MDDEGTRPELAEMARLADELVEQIGEARRHYDGLRAMLDGTDGGEAAEKRRAEDEAHLLALSMALTGVSREDARERLLEAFAIDDPEAILDEAYGAGLVDGVARRRRPRRPRLLRSRVEGAA